MAIIGYARVSTRGQNTDAQVAELYAAGAERVFVDRGESVRTADRPEWLHCLDYLRPGDTLLVRSLDRVAGGDRQAMELFDMLGERQVDIKSLTDPAIDTTTPMGRALFGFTAVLLQLRIDSIRENTMRGLAHARAQGRVGGRPRRMTADKRAAAQEMWANGDGKSIRTIARVLDTSEATVRRALALSAAEGPAGRRPDMRKPGAPTGETAHRAGADATALL